MPRRVRAGIIGVGLIVFMATLWAQPAVPERVREITQRPSARHLDLARGDDEARRVAEVLTWRPEEEV